MSKFQIVDLKLTYSKRLTPPLSFATTCSVSIAGWVLWLSLCNAAPKLLRTNIALLCAFVKRVSCVHPASCCID